MHQQTLINQIAQSLAKAGLETICSYDATTMTSSLLITKENRRLLTRTYIELHFADLEGTNLADVSAETEKCEMVAEKDLDKWKAELEQSINIKKKELTELKAKQP